MGRTLVVLALLMFSGLCESGCPVEGSPGSCSVDCGRTPLERLPSVPGLPSLPSLSSKQLHQLTQITITNCHVTTLNGSVETLHQLLVLDLSYNSIVNIGDMLLKSFPSLTSLTLHGNDISVLNDRCLESASKLQILDLSLNNISTLHGSPFEYSRLLRLNASRNHISTLTERSLRGLDSLQLIDLSLNSISVLDNSLFHALSSLQWLNLSGNHLATLSEGYFLGLSGLQRLDVSVNCISRVSGSGTVEALSGLLEVVVAGNPLGPRHKELMVLVGTGHRLRTVDASGCNLTEIPGALTLSIQLLKLAHNQLASIRRGDLDSYPLLKELDLSDNLISEVEEDALGRLYSLSSLVLGGNHLTTIPKSLPGGLQVLHLDNNNIQYLNNGDFRGLPHLKELDLRHTNMKLIEDGAFNYVPELQILNLSDNPIHRLSGSVLAGPQSLIILGLSHLSQVVSEAAQDLSFPVPSPERLQVLELQGSPVVAKQLLTDPAALAAFRDLHTLDLSHNQLTRLRSDLFHFLPRLENLRLSGNRWACDDMLWLTKWMKQQQNAQYIFGEVQCDSPPRFRSRKVVELADEDFHFPTANSPSPPILLQESSNTYITHLQSPLKQTTAQNNGYANRMLNAKLNLPIVLESLGPNTLVEATHVDKSLKNTNHHESLPLILINKESELEKNIHVRKSVKKKNAVKAVLNFTLKLADKRVNISENVYDIETSMPFFNSNLSGSESLIDNKVYLGIKNKSVSDEDELYKISNITLKPILTDTIPITKTVQKAEDTSSENKFNQRQNKYWPTLRNANKKSSRPIVKNSTAINDIILFNKAQGEKVFDKTMQDLFTNIPLRSNENFSRVKSSIHSGDNTEIYSHQPSAISRNNSISSELPKALFQTQFQTYPLSTPESITVNLNPSHKKLNASMLSLINQMARLNLTKLSKTNFTSTNNLIDLHRFTHEMINPETDSNATATWGIVREFSNTNSSQSGSNYNSSEFLVGIVHKTVPNVSHDVDGSRLFRASEKLIPHKPEKVIEGSHPGMFILIALAIGVAIVLGIAVRHFVLKRRRAVEYSRQQDIEVRSMTTIGEMW